MFNASDLKKGLKIELDGAPYIITDFTFSKPGKGQSIYNCKLKNMVNGTTMSKSFRSNDKMDKPDLEEKSLLFSYQDGEDYVFMNDDYDQVPVPAAVLGAASAFMVEDIKVDVLFYNNRPIEVTLPNFIEKEVIHTEPGARGNTATNVLKPATLDGGFEIQVPLFVNQGDIARVDTRTGAYVDRVRK